MGPEPKRWDLLGGMELGFHGGHIGEHAPSQMLEAPRFGRGLQSALMADKQGASELLFELAHGRRHHRLTDMTPLRGSHRAAGIEHGTEVLKVAQVHSMCR
jgi:hypothetical protein